MGWSYCRFCGRRNGDLELTDGTYVWPDGLAHYVEDHGVRLPEVFVEHVDERLERLARATREVAWWSTVRPAPRSVAPEIVAATEVEESSKRTVLDAADQEDVLVGREHVVHAVTELLGELRVSGAESWENGDLARYLEAFAELLQVVERTYVHAGQPVSKDPWVLLAAALRGARSYE